MVAFGHAPPANRIRTTHARGHVDVSRLVGPSGRSHSQVVLVQKFTLVSFFAQTTKPVFTDQVVERMSDLMFVRTVVAQRTMSFPKCLAERTVGIQTEAMFPFEKVGEAELISGRRRTRIPEYRRMTIHGCGHSRSRSELHGQRWHR